MSLRIVLCGGGLAAQRCAEALRAAGHDGPVTMVGAESYPPYDRPPLSKPDGVTPEPRSLRPAGWHAANGIELRTGVCAVALDVRHRRVELAGGERLPYDRLLIATGADPVRPPGFDGRPNVQVLRTVDDARRLAAALGPGVRLAVVGAGLVGQEVAASAAGRGAVVTLVDAAERPFDALVGPRSGDWLAGLHRRAGVRLRTGRRVAALEGDGRVTAVRLDDGERVACEHVLVGVGVRPATAWAAGHGLDGHGVAVDDEGRTVVAGVFAAGDAACPLDPMTGRHRSAGHWEAAARQGTAAARAMLGLPPRPTAPPLVWSDQHGVRLQRIGDPRGADAAALDGDPRAHRFIVTYERRGRLIAAVLVGRPDALPEIRRRLAAGAVHPDQGMAA